MPLVPGATTRKGKQDRRERIRQPPEKRRNTVNQMGILMIGKDVIIRTYGAGVHFGTLASREGKEVVLNGARRIWYWEGAFTLSAVAQKGVSDASKLSITVPEIVLTEAIEIIPCTEAAAANLRALKAHE